VVNWSRFDPEDYELDFVEEKLEAHNVSVEEALECFGRKFQAVRNKGYRNRYRVLGRTESGRALELVVVVDGRSIRVITGWAL
jgi:uncharacterized DUF497 family protein